ncbi:MAG: hypothetical protein ACREIR_03745 [Geminicoccaceae bacterium]
MRYSAASLYPDYLRTGCGLAVTLGPLLWLDLAGAVAALLAGLGLLFAWFGTRTVVRHLSRVELSGDAISLTGPVPRRLAWSDLARLKLAYYAPRRSRDAGAGWLQLTLSGRAGRPIRLDSTLSGFDQVLGHASRVARAKALPLDPATHANLAALGLAGSGVAPDAQSASPPARAPGESAPLGSRARY